MRKTLALFFDGTWNGPEKLARPGLAQKLGLAFQRALRRTVKAQTQPQVTSVTNVLKLMRAVVRSSTDVKLTCGACGRPAAPGSSPPHAQICLYLRGVGTDDSPLWRMIEGAFGYGIDRDIQDAYQFISHNLQDQDDLYLFGFSRGAFTARSLAGFIDLMGFIPAEKLHFLPVAYNKYMNAADDKGRADAEAYAREVRGPEKREIHIWFLGVWDTVGALWRLKSKHTRFHQTELPGNVAHAYQALALHEVRQDFQPVLWTKIGAQKVEQVWFSGSHSDVGGGYRQSGLSDASLKWMACKAVQAGLVLDVAYLGRMVGADPDAEIHDEHHGSVELWGDPRARAILRGHFSDAAIAEFWRTIGIHSNAVHRKNLDPLAGAPESLDLSNALWEAYGRGISLTKDLDPVGPRIVADGCKW